jgi:hypothetical protein
MSKRGNGYGGENRDNLLKKVKVGATWNLYPAVVQPTGKLRDKQMRYLTWREVDFRNHAIRVTAKLACKIR